MLMLVMMLLVVMVMVMTMMMTTALLAMCHVLLLFLGFGTLLVSLSICRCPSLPGMRDGSGPPDFKPCDAG